MATQTIPQNQDQDKQQQQQHHDASAAVASLNDKCDGKLSTQGPSQIPLLSHCSVPSEQATPQVPGVYGNYNGIGYMQRGTSMISPPIYASSNHWQAQQQHPQQFGMYGGMHPPTTMPSPSIASNASFSPIHGVNSPIMQNSAPFPDSPQLMDISQMLPLSSSRFRKRRQLSPLISGYVAPVSSPQQQIQGQAGQPNTLPSMQFMRRVSVPKIPVSPTSSALNVPRNRTGNHILPCFFDQYNNLRVHGTLSNKGEDSGWEVSSPAILSFLEEAQGIDEENITIIEIKQLLRRYSINATGKKTLLMDRIKTMQKLFKEDLMRRQENLVHQAAQVLASPITDKGKVSEANAASSL